MNIVGKAFDELKKRWAEKEAIFNRNRLRLNRWRGKWEKIRREKFSEEILTESSAIWQRG